MEVKNPFHNVYWVRPGLVVAGEYPGSVYRENSRAKLRWLLENGVSVFVDLTEERERVPYLNVLSEEADRLSATPEYHRQPIRDMTTPTVEAMTEILDIIDAKVEGGGVVYVHCMVGLGRTGMVVGCYLVRHGMSGKEALEEIRHLRQRDLPGDLMTSPQTEDQRNMVRAWIH